MSNIDVDMVGRPLSEIEREVFDLYVRTKELLARDDLDPCVRRNCVQSVAALNQVVNDLGLAWELLYDLGV